MKIPASVTSAVTTARNAVVSGAQRASKIVIEHPKASIPAALAATGLIGAGVADAANMDVFNKCS